MPLPKVSVIVVSYNTREKLRRCLECIESHHEIVVVDNASEDGSADMVRNAFPGVKLIASATNLGFGLANNAGCEVATGDLVLFLNSDAYAEAGAIDRLASVFIDPEVVGAGGRLLNPDGSLQASTANDLTLWAVFCEQTLLEKVFPGPGPGQRGTTLFSPYWTTMRCANMTEPWVTPQVMGACLMVRAKKGRPIELFDPRYFLYCEDTDLCLRLNRHGKIMHVPTARFTHELGSSSWKDPALGIIRYNRGKALFFRIHHGELRSLICIGLDCFGAGLRLLAWSLLAALRLFKDPRRNAQARSFYRVFTAPHRSIEGSTRTAELPRPGNRLA